MQLHQESPLKGPVNLSAQQLLRRAQRDSDAVSVFAVGHDFASTQTAIFVVKGHEHIDYLCRLAQRQGLLHLDKPVVDPQPHDVDPYLDMR